MPFLEKIEDFDLRSHNIEHYIERLEQYFVAVFPRHDKGRHRRSAILISVIGAKAYNTLVRPVLTN